MARRERKSDPSVPARLAAEAARLLVEEQIESFSAAIKKAASRLGVNARRDWPTARDVEQAVSEYQRLFHHDDQQALLRRLRRDALQAMKVLRAWKPRLVGPVLSGTATANTAITLHVFSDTAEDVGFTLAEAGIPARPALARLRDFHGRVKEYPMYAFIAGEQAIEAIVFPLSQFAHAPPDPVSARPMERADADELQALLSADATDYFDAPALR